MHFYDWKHPKCACHLPGNRGPTPPRVYRAIKTHYKCQFMFFWEMIISYSFRDNLICRKRIDTFHHILFLSKIWCHNWFLIHRIFLEKKISISAFPRDWADVEPVFHLKERIFFNSENAVKVSLNFIFTVNILSRLWLQGKFFVYPLDYHVIVHLNFLSILVDLTNDNFNMVFSFSSINRFFKLQFILFILNKCACKPTQINKCNSRF